MDLASPAMAQSGCGGQFNGGQVCGNRTGSNGLPGPTAAPVLGIPGATRGTLTFSGLSSGSPIIAPQSAAGTATLLLPTLSGTFPSTASSPLAIDAVTGLMTCTTCLTTANAFGNPTAFVGFGAVNGTATSAMRSDAAPALSTSIYSTASVALTLVERDANQNAFASNFVSKGTVIASTGTTIVLTAASTRAQYLTGTLTEIYQLPDATTLIVGEEYQFNNNSTQNLTVKNNGGTTLTTVPAGGLVTFFATDISTANGTWDFHFQTPFNVQWGSSTLQLGLIGTSLGSLSFANLTSGLVTLQPTTGALGTSIITLPAITDTMAGKALANGGTNASLVASNGGLVYSNATSLAILAGTGTANQIPLSGATAAPTWSTATYPATAAAGTILNAITSNTISATATPSLGANGGTGGQITFFGSSSGSVAVSVSTAAGTGTIFQLPSTNGTNGFFLTTNGSGITSWTAASGSGTVTNIIAGTGMTGGPITTTGTLSRSYNEATFSSSVSTPTGTISSAGVMMGIGTTCKITPTDSGRVDFRIIHNVSLATVTGIVSIQGLYGTGTAPVNGATQTGTVFSFARAITLPFAGSFAIGPQIGFVTGLSTGTSYWFDIWIQSDGTHTATAQNIGCQAIEF